MNLLIFVFLFFMCSGLSTNVCVFILYYEKEIIHCGGQQYTNINKTNNHLSHQTIGHKKTHNIWHLKATSKLEIGTNTWQC